MTITLAIATPPTSRATLPEADQQGGEGLLRLAPGHERVGRADHRHPVRVLRVDGGGDHLEHGVHVAGVDPGVQGGRLEVLGEQVAGHGFADQGRPFDVGMQRHLGRGSRSPRTTPRRCRRGGTGPRRRSPGARRPPFPARSSGRWRWRRPGTFPATRGVFSAPGRLVGTASTDRPPVSRGDTRSLARTSTSSRAVEVTRSTGPTLASIETDSGGSPSALPNTPRGGSDPDEVGAEPVELGQQRGPSRCRDAQHRHDRRYPEGDAEGGECGAPQMETQPGEAETEDVADPETASHPVSSVDHRPVPHHDASGEAGGNLRVVGYGDDGGALVVQFLEEVGYLPAGIAVQVAGGLVGEDHGRVAHQRPGDGHPLALPAGQLLGQVMHPVPETHPPQAPPRPAPCRNPARRAPVAEPFRHVVDRRGPREEEELLEHEADHRRPLSRTANGRRARSAPGRPPSPTPTWGCRVPPSG